jgi:hypothetical protein
MYHLLMACVAVSSVCGLALRATSVGGSAFTTVDNRPGKGNARGDQADTFARIITGGLAVTMAAVCVLAFAYYAASTLSGEMSNRGATSVDRSVAMGDGKETAFGGVFRLFNSGKNW